jgi:hypothetical protein
MPVSVVPEAFVKTTVSPVLSVTVIDAPSSIVSLRFAVMLMVDPAMYVPSALVEENDVIEGCVVSTVIVIADEAADTTPLLVCTEEIDHVPSASVPKSQPDCAVAVNEHVTLAEPAFVAVTVTVLPLVTLATEMVGVLSDVTLSEFDEPLSELATTVGVAGAVGGVK